jgi:transcriptional regulator with XRE-family HTH domain
MRFAGSIFVCFRFHGGKDVMRINAKEIGQRIKALRKGKGLTQEGFAEAVGLTVSAVSKIEIGDRVPSIDTFVLLSDFFGVSLDYLVLGKEH